MLRVLMISLLIPATYHAASKTGQPILHVDVTTLFILNIIYFELVFFRGKK